MTTRPTGRQRGRPPYPLLTPAEERVLQFIRKGHTNGEIAERLGVSLDAVKYHVSNMLGKLELRSREELAGWRPQRNPLARLWGAIPLAVKLGAGGAVATAVAGGAVLAALSPAAEAPLYEGVVTVGYDGQPANGSSEMLQISGDGRYVVYASWASNLVPDDQDTQMDVFRFDRETNKTELVSIDETSADGGAGWPQVSNDGRFVAYSSAGSEGRPRAVVRDMSTGAASFIADDFTGAPALSGDGRFLSTMRNDEPGVMFPKGTLLIYDVYQGSVAWSVPVDREVDPLFIGQEFRLSMDGRWLAFLAGEVPGATCERRVTSIQINGITRDVPLRRPFVHDLVTGETWCTPIGDAADIASQPGPLGMSGNTLVYGISRWEPDSRIVIDSQLALYDMGSRHVHYLTRAGEPFFGTDIAPGAANNGRILAILNNPAQSQRGQVNGILWMGAGSEREVVERPARFEDWGLSHSEPVLSEDGRSLAFAVRGQDRTSGSQVQDIYVVSR
ncbi:MAG: LuxR C-terminal-related transcriptional regulator [Dehalococcoidia bacterium]